MSFLCRFEFCLVPFMYVPDPLPQLWRYVIVEIGKCAFDEVGIELRTRASPHFFGGLSKGNRFVVGALVDHRIDAIHNREHARAEWNILAL